MVLGAALVVLGIRRGALRERCGNGDRLIVLSHVPELAAPSTSP